MASNSTSKSTMGRLLLACAVLVAGGCGGGGGGGVSGGPPAPAGSNPVDLAFRSTELAAPAASDGRNYRTPEFMGHHGLAAISADTAYQRGYFGQDVTIAVADDGLDPTHPDLAGRIRAPRHVRNRNANVFEPGGAGDLGTGQRMRWSARSSIRPRARRPARAPRRRRAHPRRRASPWPVTDDETAALDISHVSPPVVVTPVMNRTML